VREKARREAIGSRISTKIDAVSIRRTVMCETYWQKKGDKWVMVLAEEDELSLVGPTEEDDLEDVGFPPIKPVLEESKEKRRPRAVLR